MKRKVFSIARTMAIAFGLSAATVATAQENNRERVEGAAQSNQDKETVKQGQTACEICGLTVEKAPGETKGLKVVDVKSDSPAAEAAAEAGVQVGDILVSIDGQNLDSGDRLKQLFSQKQNRSEQTNVNVTLRRNNRNRQVTLTLARADQSSDSHDRSR